MENKEKGTISVLVVEDNYADAMLFSEVTEALNRKYNLIFAEDGIEALDKLRETGNLDLILLDLNLPRMDGRQVLKYIKEHEDYKIIPVIILTSSEAEEDIQASYRLHANSYIRKPLNLEDFFNMAKKIEAFWLETAMLPTRVK